MSRTKRNIPSSGACLRRPQHKNYHKTSEAFVEQLVEYSFQPRNRDKKYLELVPTSNDDISVYNELKFKRDGRVLNKK